MKTKIISFAIFSVLSLIMLASLASADLTSMTKVSAPESVNRDMGSSTNSFNIVFNLTTDASESVTFNGSSTISDVTITFNETSPLTINGTQQVTATVTYDSDVAEDSISGTLSSSDGTITKSLTFDVPVKPDEISGCLVTGNSPDNLEIRKIKFSSNGIADANFGSDDEWYLLSDIEVQIDIRNTGDEKINDVEVNWGLWDTDTKQWVIEPVDEDTFDLKKDKTETLTIDINLEDDADVDLDEIDDGDNYIFYVFATGTDTGTDPEEDVCASDYKDVTIVVEDDFVVLDNLDYPELASCGDNFQITADVWNIGSDDQDDVYVTIFNSELGISEQVDFSSIDAYDFEDLDISVKIPKNAQEKTYYLKLDVYDENDDIYESDSDESEFFIPVVVSGSCTSTSSTAKAVVSAGLESEAKAGSDLVVKSTISNTGDESTTYAISATDYSDWASSASLDKNVLTIASGDSADVLITLKVEDTASGENSFNIKIVSDGEIVKTQPVSVTIAGKSGFSSITGAFAGSNNLIWGIGILNVILIIVIIIVAIRIASK